LVIALSSVKFIGGPTLAFHYKFNFVETVFYTVAGGMLGVIIFSFFSDWLVLAWERIRSMFLTENNKARNSFDPEGKVVINGINVKATPERKKKIFTRKNRWLVKLRRKYGLIGIAALTPVILSIPVGSFIAERLARDRKKVILYMFISILAWSLILTTMFELYHVFTIRDLEKEIIK
jgi:hypothetical protein